MFNLEQAIAEWRTQFVDAGVQAPEILDELESHLRDEIEQQTHAGLEAQRAFELAVRGIGQAGALRCEFRKVGRKKQPLLEKVKDAMLVFAAAGSHYNSNDMNTPSSNTNLEPRWATYAKAAAFLVPALSLWAFSAVFLFPKVQQICRDAGLPGSWGETAMAAVMRNGYFILQHGLWLSVGVVLALMLLEWRSERWPRYRRATVGVGVFLVNAAIMALITLTLMMALLAAPALFHAR